MGTLEEYLRSCREGEVATRFGRDWVPQFVYWMIDEDGKAIGTVRIRPRLSERLLQCGGHVGYYVQRSERGKGHAKAALRMALEILAKMGVMRVLVTVDPANAPSIAVALANGGVQDGQGMNPENGRMANRYWIEPPKKV